MVDKVARLPLLREDRVELEMLEDLSDNVVLAFSEGIGITPGPGVFILLCVVLLSKFTNFGLFYLTEQSLCLTVSWMSATM